MARTARRPKPKDRHYRCARCRSLLPTVYNVCANCGYDHARINRFMEQAKAMFPGSAEL